MLRLGCGQASLSWSHSMKQGTLITADSLRSPMRLEFTGDYFFLPAPQFRLTNGAQTGPQLVVWFNSNVSRGGRVQRRTQLRLRANSSCSRRFLSSDQSRPLRRFWFFAGSFGARAG